MDNDEKFVLVKNVSFTENSAIAQFRKLIVELRTSQVSKNSLSEKDIAQAKSIIDSVCNLGLIKTLSLLSQLVQEMVFEGEIRPIRINDIEENSPWKWDQITKYLTILENNDFLKFGLDKHRNKTCSLDLSSKETTIEIKRLFEYYTNSYKKDKFTQGNISNILQLTDLLHSRKRELALLEQQFRKQELYPLSDKEFSQYIGDIIEGFNQYSSDDFINPQKSIAKAMSKNPLFLKGISKGEK